MTPKTLTLTPFNNCLQCDAFLYITRDAGRPISEKDLEQVFLIKSDEHEFFARVVDVYRVTFGWMPGMATIAATGLELQDWKAWYKSQHPDTNNETKFLVLSYKKVDFSQ